MNVSKLLYVLLFAVLTNLVGCASSPKPVADKPPEQLYAEGEAAFQKRHYNKAVELWKQVRETFPEQELDTKAEIGIANAYYLDQEYIEAATAYEDFRKLHPTHELAQFALYHQGLASYNLIESIDTDQTPVKNALALFEEFVRQYPASEYIDKVKEKIADCRGKMAEYEIYVGRFYYRTGNPKAAAGRLELALANFPDYTGHDKTLIYLARASKELKDTDKMRTTLARLVREYPNSKYLGDARKMLAEKK